MKDFGYYAPNTVEETISLLGKLQGETKVMCGEQSMRLENDTGKAIEEPCFIKRARELQPPIVYRNSKNLGDYVARNYEAFGKLIVDTGLAKWAYALRRYDR